MDYRISFGMVVATGWRIPIYAGTCLNPPWVETTCMCRDSSVQAKQVTEKYYASTDNPILTCTSLFASQHLFVMMHVATQQHEHLYNSTEACKWGFYSHFYSLSCLHTAIFTLCLLALPPYIYLYTPLYLLMICLFTSCCTIVKWNRLSFLQASFRH